MCVGGCAPLDVWCTSVEVCLLNASHVLSKQSNRKGEGHNTPDPRCASFFQHSVTFTDLYLTPGRICSEVNSSRDSRALRGAAWHPTPTATSSQRPSHPPPSRWPHRYKTNPLVRVRQFLVRASPWVHHTGTPVWRPLTHALMLRGVNESADFATGTIRWMMAARAHISTRPKNKINMMRIDYFYSPLHYLTIDAQNCNWRMRLLTVYQQKHVIKCDEELCKLSNLLACSN